MKIVVCVKQVAVLGDEIELDATGTAVDPDLVDRTLNEWDAHAAEEALRIREALGGEVVVVSASGDEATDAIVRCLAMGADRGVRVACGALDEPLRVAQALAAAIGPEAPDLVLAGAQSADAAHGATGAALAGLLGLPCVPVVRRIEIAAGGGRAVAERELEGGLVDVVEADLPAVLTVQTGINDPRYVTLRPRRAAAEQPIAVIEPPPGDAPSTRLVRLSRPAQAGSAEMLAGAPAEIAARIAAIVRERLA